MNKAIKLAADTIIVGCTHINHAKSFVFEKRGYPTIQEHDDDICHEIRDYCMGHPTASMIHLGDGFLNSTPEKARAYFARWGIKTYYIWGNHEGPTHQLYQAELARIGFKTGAIYPLDVATVTFLGKQATFYIDKQMIVANHFPLAIWDKSHHGAWHIHSHNHHSFPQSHADYLACKRLDCGVDSCLKYFGKPYMTFAQLKTIMDKKRVHQVDHHDSTTT